MYALFKKEISNFLNSLIGIMVIVIFLLITGLFLWVFQSDFNIMTFGYANLDSLFILAPWVFLFLVPAVTMRSFAEEKRTGTMEMLFTKPLSDWQIVLGKYFAGGRFSTTDTTRYTYAHHTTTHLHLLHRVVRASGSRLTTQS